MPHKIDLPKSVVARLTAARGRVHVFPDLDPRKTALLVVDLQNAYMVPGQAAYLRTAAEIVPNVNRLAAAMRAAGAHVVWLRQTVTAESQKEWPLYLEAFSGKNWEAKRDALTAGAFGHEIFGELDVQSGDEIVNKTRYSAFAHHASDLHARLSRRGIDTLVITGAVTGVCCGSTAQDAMMLNYKVHVVADATACHSDEEQNAVLAGLMGRFADIRTVDEIIALCAPR